MQRIDLVVESDLDWSTRTKQVAAMFDLQRGPSREEWHFDLNLPDEWQVGLIVGASGSGKSTVARELFGGSIVSFDWNAEQSVIDGFPISIGIKDVARALSSVGFSSPPAWLRPFHVLSMGQQFRAELARALVLDQDLVVVDEFTSVVDRTVAKIGSAAVSSAVRRSSKKFVAVSCHHDVVEWLQPDWILHMPEGRLEERCLRRFPDIKLEISRASRSSWELFRRDHYLSHSIANSAKCYVASWDGRLVAFVAVLSFPHPKRPGYRGHRTVCLPDFQGVGIGNAFSNLIAAAYTAKGVPFRSVTSHPAMIRHRARSKFWRMFRKPSRIAKRKTESWETASFRRLTASFEYVDPPNKAAALALGLLS